MALTGIPKSFAKLGRGSGETSRRVGASTLHQYHPFAVVSQPISGNRAAKPGSNHYGIHKFGVLVAGIWVLAGADHGYHLQKLTCLKAGLAKQAKQSESTGARTGWPEFPR